jgi:hypothetical protein
VDADGDGGGVRLLDVDVGDVDDPLLAVDLGDRVSIAGEALVTAGWRVRGRPRVRAPSPEAQNRELWRHNPYSPPWWQDSAEATALHASQYSRRCLKRRLPRE